MPGPERTLTGRVRFSAIFAIGSGVEVGVRVGVRVGTWVLVAVGSGEGVGVNVGTGVEVFHCTVGCTEVGDNLTSSVTGDGVGVAGPGPLQAATPTRRIGIETVAIRDRFIIFLNDLAARWQIFLKPSLRSLVFSEIICTASDASK